MAKTVFYSLAVLVRKILFCHSKIKFISSHHHLISSMYIRIVLILVSYQTFSTSSKYSFSSGVGYVVCPILLIMWTAFQSFILRDNNNNNNNIIIIMHVQLYMYIA